MLPDSKDLRFSGGVFLGCVGSGGGGGTAGVLGFSAGSGFAGEALRGLAGGGGFIPQLDSSMSSSEHPSHPNSTTLTQQGVFAAHVSVRAGALPVPHPRQDGAIPLGVEQQQLVKGGNKAMLNSAVPNLYRMRTPATSVGFTSTSTTCDSAIHKCVHKTRS